jgi:hypothetical protein
MKCGIKHGFGDQTCIREKGNEGRYGERETSKGNVEAIVANRADTPRCPQVGVHRSTPLPGQL